MEDLVADLGEADRAAREGLREDLVAARGHGPGVAQLRRRQHAQSPPLLPPSLPVPGTVSPDVEALGDELLRLHVEAGEAVGPVHLCYEQVVELNDHHGAVGQPRWPQLQTEPQGFPVQ